MMIPHDVSGWAQAGLAGLIAACGTVFWAGESNQHLQSMQAQVQQVQMLQEADHAKIAQHDTKLDDIQSDVSEIKQDVKSLLQRRK